MNKQDAKLIAETITNEQLQQMFETAKDKITNWEKVSNVNKGLSIGTAWNILAKNFNVNQNYHNLTKVNMIREFGEFLPDDLKPKKKITKKPIIPIHQDPIF